MWRDVHVISVKTRVVMLFTLGVFSSLVEVLSKIVYLYWDPARKVPSVSCWILGSSSALREFAFQSLAVRATSFLRLSALQESFVSPILFVTM